MAISATQMVQKIMTALQTQSAGVVSVTVDGQVVTYNRAQAIEELKFWEQRAASEKGTRPRVSRIVLGGF